MRFRNILKRQGRSALISEATSEPSDSLIAGSTSNEQNSPSPTGAAISMTIVDTVSQEVQATSTAPNATTSTFTAGLVSTTATTLQPTAASIALTTTAQLLTTAKTLVSLAPIPGIATAADVVIQIVQLLDTKHRNDETLRNLISEILDFLQVVKNACEGLQVERLPPVLSQDLDDFVQQLQGIKQSCEAYFRRGFLRRYLTATSWQHELVGFRDHMNTAKAKFDFSSNIELRTMVASIQQNLERPQMTMTGEVDSAFEGAVFDGEADIMNRVGVNGGPPLALSTAFKGSHFKQKAVIVNNVGCNMYTPHRPLA